MRWPMSPFRSLADACHPLIALITALIISAGAIGSPTPSSAQIPPIELSLPVDCAMGRDCFIQNYFDHAPGPARQDHACGRLSYDGHDGIDFRTRDVPQMQRGVDVRAAAPGTVRATRDGMPDINVRETGVAAVEGREAGNGVLIDHGNGWMTQYSHLLEGSVTVGQGDRVERGMVLGRIGLSGLTEFPHVEFSVRYQGRPVDPFVGPMDFPGCGQPLRPLWTATAQAALDYIETDLLISGFHTGRPDQDAAQQGTYRRDAVSADATALVYWVELFGVLAGDIQRFTLFAPDGAPVSNVEDVLDDSYVSWFAFAGERFPNGIPPGRYVGRYSLVRGGQLVVLQQDSVTVR